MFCDAKIFFRQSGADMFERKRVPGASGRTDRREIRYRIRNVKRTTAREVLAHNDLFVGIDTLEMSG